MACTVDKVYIGLANSIDKELTEDGVSIDHSLITRVRVFLNDDADTIIDSQSQPSLFDWDLNPWLSMKLGLSSPAIAEGAYNASLVVHDSTNPQGIMWALPLNIQVIAL